MYVTVNGIELYYEVHGDGPALIMMHGNGEDHTIFDRALFYLEKHFKVYLLDSRGHGSSSPVGEYHYSDMVEDIHDFITALEIEDPIIYGFSDGGIVALMFAMKHPGIASRLIVSGANTRPSTIKGMWMTRFVQRFRHDPKVEMMLREPDITADDLSTIDIPVLVTAGSRDCISRDDTDFIVSNLPKGKLCILQRHDHSSYIIHSTDIADVILTELKPSAVGR